MELEKHYNLFECSNLRIVKSKLKGLEKEGKIEFEIFNEILKIDDIDLDSKDIINLSGIFDKYCVYPYPDYEDNSDDIGDYYDYYDDDDDF